METITKTIPQLSNILANGNTFLTLRIFLKLFFLAVITKFFVSDFYLQINVFYKDKRFKYKLNNISDIYSLKEIYIDNEYGWFPKQDLKVIVDLGAHFGDTALYYSAHFPEALVIAVEPSPVNYKRLVENTKSFSNILTINAAVGAKKTKVGLRIMPSSLGHSIKDRSGSTAEVVVDQITIRDVLEYGGVAKADLIKFDIEGAEFDVFLSIEPHEFSNAYIGEVHEDISGRPISEIKEKFNLFETSVVSLEREGRYIITAK